MGREQVIPAHLLPPRVVRHEGPKLDQSSHPTFGTPESRPVPLCVLKSQELLVLGAGIQSAVEQLSSQPDTACSFGVYGRQGSKRVSLAELLAPGADEWWAGPIEFERLADDYAAPLSYPTNGLFLFTVETEPVALLVRHDDDEHPFLLRLELACRSVDHAD